MPVAVYLSIKVSFPSIHRIKERGIKVFDFKYI